jgi:3-phenylpropionate/cinnamic acid dioxygenase small subunit
MTLPLQETAETGQPGTADLYYEVQNFYAHQMQLLDSGDVAAWAETFTEDGVFAANTQDPVTGRDSIHRAAEAVHEALHHAEIRHRHWLGMMDVRPVSPERLQVRSYALILAIPVGGQATVHVSTTCDDELVRDNGSWLVRHRRVVRDDLALEGPPQ